jgi:hypothetical protein
MPARREHPDDPHPDDALVEELLDEALAGYEELMTPEALEALREEIGDVLAATEDGRRLLRQIRPDPSVQRSADLPAPGAEAAAEANVRTIKKVSG